MAAPRSSENLFKNMDISFSSALKAPAETKPVTPVQGDDGGKSSFSQMLDRMNQSARSDESRAADRTEASDTTDEPVDPTAVANTLGLQVMPQPQQQTPANATSPSDSEADTRVEDATSKPGEKSTKTAEATASEASAAPNSKEGAETPATVKPFAEQLLAAADTFSPATPDLTPQVPSIAAPAQQPVQQAPQTTATVPVPVTSPAFAPAFSHQVTVFVKDRAQTAELRLNPDDIGPVTVKINITESRAEINFAVTSPEAKAAIQNALPQLRESLAAQGLELGGASVDQRAPDAFPAPQNASGRPGNGGSAEGATGSDAPVRRAVGLVDTWA